MTNDTALAQRPQQAGAKSAAIVQSSYIPWKGYFDLINLVDVFILYDDVQYTRRDWRNRNLIKTRDGLHWLTIPVEVKGKYTQKIRETRVSDPDWGRKHWTAICHSYAKARHFPAYRALFESLYLNLREEMLSQINFRFIRAICDALGITTKIVWSSDFILQDGQSERLIGLCKSVGATRYLSGPSAKDYLDESKFADQGMSVAWMDYSGYPPYTQLFGAFEHGVSILDLIFNEGQQAPRYMKSFADK
jgi:hypothetical protein